MVVERGISQRQNRLGPGVCVTCKAREFGEDYAKELFGRGWKSGRLKGKIEKAVGNHEWSVRCAAPPLPCPAAAPAAAAPWTCRAAVALADRAWRAGLRSTTRSRR